MSDSVTPWLYSPWNSPGENTGVGSLPILQSILPTQGLKPGLLHFRGILYQLSHKGSPKILEWVPIPSPEDLAHAGIKIGSPALQVDSLPTEISGKPICEIILSIILFYLLSLLKLNFPASQNCLILCFPGISPLKEQKICILDVHIKFGINVDFSFPTFGKLISHICNIM